MAIAGRSRLRLKGLMHGTPRKEVVRFPAGSITSCCTCSGTDSFDAKEEII